MVASDRSALRANSGRREFELLDGEVIELTGATYRHNLIVSSLTGLLLPALRGKGEAVSNADISPDVAVEVISPSESAFESSAESISISDLAFTGGLDHLLG
jgi:Uma2 family endonuclease